jgi:peptide/nickel transport system permease protein
MIALVEALVVYLVVGLGGGLIAGYYQNVGGAIAEKISELMLAVPALVFVLLVISVYPGNLFACMVTVGLLNAAGLVRVTRAVTLTVRHELFIDSARVSGLPEWRILFRHVLPQVMPAAIAQASLFAGFAVLVQAAIAFLGLTAPPPQPSWGGMVAEGLQQISLDPWLVVPAGLLIALVTLCFALLGDAINATLSETVAGQRWQRAGRSKDVRRRLSRVVAEGNQGLAQPGGSSVRDIAARGDRETAEEGTGEDVALLVEGLNVRFRTGGLATSVVSDVSFAVSRGEVLGIVGESGAGKSTLIKAILGVLPDAADVDVGRVTVAGYDARDLGRGDPERLRGRVVGYVSQHPLRGLDPTFTIRSLLVEALMRNCDVPRSVARGRLPELLASVQLSSDVAQRRVFELSGGMAQRVSIALALLGGVQLVVADEPTSALDVTVQAGVLRLLRSLQQERGLALVVVTHNWRVVEGLCDRVMVLYAGQVVEEASAGECAERPLHPYTTGLLGCLPGSSKPGERLRAIPGTVPRPGEWGAGCRFASRCSECGPECLTAPIELTPIGPGRRVRCVMRVLETAVAKADTGNV